MQAVGWRLPKRPRRLPQRPAELRCQAPSRLQDAANYAVPLLGVGAAVGQPWPPTMPCSFRPHYAVQLPAPPVM